MARRNVVNRSAPSRLETHQELEHENDDDHEDLYSQDYPNQHDMQPPLPTEPLYYTNARAGGRRTTGGAGASHASSHGSLTFHPGDDEDASNVSGLVSNSSWTTHHSVRQDSKWRRKTRHLLENAHFVQQQEGQARRAGHLAAEHFWKLASELNPVSSGSSSTLWYSTKLSEVASAESFDLEHDDEEDSQEGSTSSFERTTASGSRKKAKRNGLRSLFSGSKASVNASQALAGGDASNLHPDDSTHTNQSLASSERAMRRGIRRGQREANEEKRARRRGVSSSHADSTTQGETQTMDTGFGAHWLFHKIPTPTRANGQKRNHHKPRHYMRSNRAMNFIRNNMVNPYPAFDDEDADAWMCGVCGKAFTTLEAADTHEQDHIQLVVDSLPWIKEEKAQKKREAALAKGDMENSSYHDAASSHSLASSIRTNGNNEEEGDTYQDGNIIHKFMGDAQNRGRGQERNNGAHENGDKFLTPKQASVKKRISFDIVDDYRSPQEPPEDGDARTPPTFARSTPIPDELLDEVLGGTDGGDLTNDLGLEENGLKEEENPLLIPAGEIVSPPRLPRGRPEPVYEEEKQEIDANPNRNHNHTNGNRLPPDDWPLAMEGVGQHTLVPKLRSEARFHQEDAAAAAAAAHQEHMLPVRDVDPLLSENAHDQEGEPQEALLLSSAVRDYVILADEALVTVCEKARKLILSPEEMRAEKELMYMAKDKAYYDNLAKRAQVRKHDPNYSKYRHEGQNGIVGKVQNKFVDAYHLMKDGTDKKGFRDEYENRMKKNAQGGPSDQKLVAHSQQTMYLNVMVKNGIQVVKNELERLAQERWENEEDLDKFTRFERFRVYAHVNMVRLAGLALSSDFTPRRIAVQLSNDIYRLLTPRLKRKGVMIETEIEYRVGPYFVLAVNIINIDWRRLLKATHRDVEARNTRWKQAKAVEKEGSGDDKKEEKKQPSAFAQFREYLMQVSKLTQHDVVATMLAILYRTHWLFYQPICILCYYTFFGSAIRHFILSSVADDIFNYVEEKGMEMEIGIRKASVQAAFMLSALREIRADSKDHRKKQQQSAGQEKQDILGPLLGPSIPADKEVVPKPPDFEVPENLEFVGLELDLEVGFHRLRWALLNVQSTFLSEALYRVEAKYENITMGTWDHHNEFIGLPKLPDDVNEADFLGAEKTCSYIMPKSAFVKANLCTETHFVLAYNDYCFTLKKRALTPDVPYGSTFIAWTQFTVINTGDHTCRITCSVEPEFPNGPPLVSRQIKSGMRAGVGELFVLIGQTISKYADEYP
uniref:C2H2-type domain-containing protein n=1 Tax=Entomoneis paludosa TaxID=265537 RepID=A0A7S2V8H4_9STRA|mmetsp:Transcript_11341/g.23237  ORF Transcript_11341/g.23237 Transcript_11341/m.23237 type:complete len:1278 (+) Transcript_11341:329-4162(+)